MRSNILYLAVVALGGLLPSVARTDVIYNNLTPNNSMAMATRPDAPGQLEIEAADDFLLSAETLITGGSLTGLLAPSANGGATSVADVVVEIYRVFPKDSDTVRTPAVPTRINSPSDNALGGKDSGAGELSFVTSTLAASFTANNSVGPGGIHPSPNQTTGGNGAVRGAEVQIDFTFATPFDLPADHYFFVPQVQLTNGAQFYWLSASRGPISGPGTTPFSPDLQAWIRDGNLDPDWLRVGTDIVGGATPPTFNAAFSLAGTTIPEPASGVLLFGGLAVFGLARGGRRLSNRRQPVDS
ncbi:MAG TPA: PEP-CTERM sorting domain-containing protein [Bryobacteraceae bacterium]|nr:PEP-CTERM sorting domain-containing protein [Bryobacteraceae bacterium]